MRRELSHCTRDELAECRSIKNLCSLRSICRPYLASPNRAWLIFTYCSENFILSRIVTVFSRSNFFIYEKLSKVFYLKHSFGTIFYLKEEITFVTVLFWKDFFTRLCYLAVILEVFFQHEIEDTICRLEKAIGIFFLAFSLAIVSNTSGHNLSFDLSRLSNKHWSLKEWKNNAFMGNVLKWISVYVFKRIFDWKNEREPKMHSGTGQLVFSSDRGSLFFRILIVI